MGEVVLGLLAVAVVLGLPVTLLIVSLTAFSRTSRLQRQLMELEREVHELRLAVRAHRATSSAPSPMVAAPARAAEPPPAAPVSAAESVVVDSGSPVGLPASGLSQPGPTRADPSDAVPGIAEEPFIEGVPESVTPVHPPAPRRPTITPERLAMWLAAGLGGLSVVLASLFALSAAIERGWVGPAVRIGIGLVMAMMAWWGGTVARGRKLQWVGSALVGAGVAGLCGTLYASNVLYDLLSTPVTFGLLALVSAVALLTGVRQGSRFDAWLGLLGGLATPVLVKATEPRPMVLFGYLTVLVAGTVGAAARRGWAELILGAAAGFSAVFVGWTLSGSRPSDQPIALAVVVLLGVVFVAAERWARDDRTTRVVTAVVGALVPLLALAWVVPAEPLFYDPRSGLTVFRPTPHGPWLAAAGLVLALAPSVVAQRVLWGRRLASGVAVVLAVVFAVGWAEVPTPAWLPLALGLGAVPLLGLGRRPSPTDPGSSSVWLLPVATGLAAAAAMAAGESRPEGILAMGLVAVVPGVILALGRRDAMLYVPALVGATLPLALASTAVEAVGSAVVAGPASLGFGLFGTLPLLQRDTRARTTVAAALAGPAFFLPLYRAWEGAGGLHVIGLLPVLLGAVALVGALTLVRQHGAKRDSGPLALFVGVTLLGLTAAIPIQLRDQWVTVAWALEAVAVALASRRLHHGLLRWTAVLLGAAITVRLVANPWALEYAGAGGWPVLNWTLYTWGVPAISLLATAWLLGPSRDRERPVVPDWTRLGLVLGAVAVGFALVNVEVSHAFQDSGPIELGGRGVWQGMVRSLAWAGYGIAILAAGTARDHRIIRMVGFVVVLAAAGKVFLSDLWSLSGFVRVGSIAGLGVTLLVAAFVFERLVLRRASDDEGGLS